MPLLNEPLGYDETASDDDWSPLRGLMRGLRLGLIVAAVCAVVLIPLAVYVPYMIIIWWLRVPLAFGLAWVLFKAVQRGAGMVGWPCALIALGLTAIVLCSNHIVFAIAGTPEPAGVDPWWIPPAGLLEHLVETREGQLIGWSWCCPAALAAENLLPLILGGGFATAVCNR